MQLDNIFHGDSLGGYSAHGLAFNSLDSCITDPPYNIGYSYHECSDNMNWADYFDVHLELIKEIAQLLKEGGSFLWLNYPEACARMWTMIDDQIDELSPVKWITWIYHQHTGGKPLRKATRAWIWFSKGEPYIDPNALAGTYRNPDDIRIRDRIDSGFRPVDYDWWYYEQVKNVSAEKVNHPCQLPLAMVMRLVEMVTPKGGIVLDPFSGSGTTPVAAKKLARHWIGVESDAKYVEESRRRLAAVSRDLAEEDE